MRSRKPQSGSSSAWPIGSVMLCSTGSACSCNRVGSAIRTTRRSEWNGQACWIGGWKNERGGQMSWWKRSDQSNGDEAKGTEDSGRGGVMAKLTGWPALTRFDVSLRSQNENGTPRTFMVTQKQIKPISSAREIRTGFAVVVSLICCSCRGSCSYE